MSQLHCCSFLVFKTQVNGRCHVILYLRSQNAKHIPHLWTRWALFLNAPSSSVDTSLTFHLSWPSCVPLPFLLLFDLCEHPIHWRRIFLSGRHDCQAYVSPVSYFDNGWAHYGDQQLIVTCLFFFLLEHDISQVSDITHCCHKVTDITYKKSLLVIYFFKMSNFQFHFIYNITSKQSHINDWWANVLHI